MADPGFPRGGTNPKGEGRQNIIQWKILKTAWNWGKLGRGEICPKFVCGSATDEIRMNTNSLPNNKERSIKTRLLWLTHATVCCLFSSEFVFWFLIFCICLRNMLGCSVVMISLLVDSLNHFYLALTNTLSKSILCNNLQRWQITRSFKITTICNDTIVWNESF